MLDSSYKPIKNRVVRDLAWALLSTPLLEKLKEDSTDLLQQEYIADKNAIADWLLAIDQSPERLIDYIQLRSKVRIGIYFEQLLGFYFSHYPRFELLHQNLQVQGVRRTLGEFDFIILDKSSGLYFHIESAVKFYLGHFQSSLLAGNIESYNWQKWIGPNKKDSLSLKMHSMLNKQLQLSKTPEAHQLLADKRIDAKDLQTRLLLRGRFFCHNKNNETPRFACHDAYQYYWHTVNDFRQDQTFTLQYIILPRTDWLSPLLNSDILDNNLVMKKNALLNIIQKESQHGIKTWMIAGVDDTQPRIELERFFIIDEN